MLVKKKIINRLHFSLPSGANKINESHGAIKNCAKPRPRSGSIDARHTMKRSLDPIQERLQRNRAKTYSSLTTTKSGFQISSDVALISHKNVQVKLVSGYRRISSYFLWAHRDFSLGILFCSKALLRLFIRETFLVL